MAFDCPDFNTTALTRTASNTPIQALTTLNNETFVEAAQALARNLLAGTGRASDEERLTEMLRRCLAKPATSFERERFRSLLARARDHFLADEGAARRLTDRHRAPGGAAAESAAWTTVARIALNLDEFLTRE